MDVAVVLRRALARLNRRLRNQNREPGLSLATHSILGLLYREGPTTPGALAAAEGIQPQSLTRVLASLEESGHVLRLQDATDRRQFNLEITRKGRDVLDRDARRRAVWLASAMTECLTETELEMLRLAAQLIDRLADASADASREDCGLGQEEDLMTPAGQE